MATPRLLVIDDRVPHIDKGAGDPRMGSLLESLRRGFPEVAVTFVAREEGEGGDYSARFAELDIEFVWGQPDWSAWFEDHTGMFDGVIVSRPDNVEWARPFIDRTQPQARLAFDAESLFFRRLERMVPLLPVLERRVIEDALEHYRAVEVNAMGWADVVLAVSDDAAQLASAVAPDQPVVIVRHEVMPLDDVPPFAAREGLTFYGGFLAGANSPNEDAAVIAARELQPSLHEALGATLRIVGADPTPVVEALASADVEVIGSVADPFIWLQSSRVHVSPLRFGAGLKLRFIDSMVAGLPFVTTTVGAEDLGLDDDLAAVLVADDPIAQIELVTRLYQDEVRWTDASERLRAMAAAAYSEAPFDRSVTDVMVQLGFAPGRRIT